MNVRDNCMNVSWQVRLIEMAYFNRPTYCGRDPCATYPEVARL